MDDAIDFDELDIGRKLGEGFYGEVFLGDYLGTAVAIKAMKGGGSGAGAGATQASFLEEARLLATLRHPSIIMWMGIASPPDAEDLYIVTEFAANGDLLSLLLRTDVDLSWRLRVRWLQEVARALLYLHSKRLIHRDVKAGTPCRVLHHVQVMWGGGCFFLVFDFAVGITQRTWRTWSAQPYTRRPTKDIFFKPLSA